MIRYVEVSEKLRLVGRLNVVRLRDLDDDDDDDCVVLIGKKVVEMKIYFEKFIKLVWSYNIVIYVYEEKVLEDEGFIIFIGLKFFYILCGKIVIILYLY